MFYCCSARSHIADLVKNVEAEGDQVPPLPLLERGKRPPLVDAVGLDVHGGPVLNKKRSRCNNKGEDIARK